MLFFIISCDNEDAGIETETILPCDFFLNEVTANSTITLDCIVDLNGETITLPENITLVYDGGDIINGTIIFSDNSLISGELLNSSLTISGSIPQLQEPLFHFYADRWEITQGEVSGEIAVDNRNIINHCINLVHSMSVEVFAIDNIDAFFDVTTATGSPGHDLEATIFIPSNFHFKMGDDCNLRVQPNGSERSVLIASKSTENITISGGKLWGDRYTHNYTTINNTHEWGHIMDIRGVHNSIVDGVEMHEGTGDGIHIAGISHRNNDGTLKPNGRETNNLTVKNCLINDNRRNNISITDGTDIYIEYNTIRNSGSGDDDPEVSANGTSPRAGIDIEAYKWNAPDDNSVYDLEKTEDIHIRNNIFEDNYAVDVVFYNGEKTYVYENTFRSSVALSTAYGYNNKIYNNNFERPEGLMNGSQAINLAPRYWANGNHRVIDFEVYDNTFTGYQFGIVAGGQGHTFTNNVMTNCERGIIIITSEDLEFDNNIISSNVEGSYGYFTFSVETPIKSSLIQNGEVNVQYLALYFSNNNNNDGGGDLIIDNVDFNGDITLRNAQDITIMNSSFNDINIIDCDPTLINNKALD